MYKLTGDFGNISSLPSRKAPSIAFQTQAPKNRIVYGTGLK